jgi:hypothetical protein
LPVRAAPRRPDFDQKQRRPFDALFLAKERRCQTPYNTLKINDIFWQSRRRRHLRAQIEISRRHTPNTD